jgi:hypothetical protein
MVARGIQKSGDVVYREFGSGEGGVLLHLKTGQYYGVNRLGAAIWSLLDGERTEEAVVAEVRESEDQFPPSFEVDVERFLEGLRRRDLVR